MRAPLLFLPCCTLLVACGPPSPPSVDGVTVTTNSGSDATTEALDDESSEVDSGDGDGGCFDAPDECLRYVECIAALVPSQLDVVEAQVGEGGTCWCGDQDQAQECYETCVSELAKAIDANPTVSACHPESCSLDELDPSQPYGPIVDGQCPDYEGVPQVPVVNPLGVPGSVCSPPCGDLSAQCPEHTQTSARGACKLFVNNMYHCATYCHVDPLVVGGNQCQCGATCRPLLNETDSEGNLRGLCTFD